jgi:ATP-dependent RNA helicase SUPV3L1/SUV3
LSGFRLHLRLLQQIFDSSMSARGGRANEGRITAVVGPTNTGKTHLAVDRFLAHKSGIIGLPLRLLAREIYDRVVGRRNPRSVALITGEERIVPPHPTHFICTVEAMPTDRPVDFLAVDEIQLCGDLERGHVFTDRLLHARGRKETMFLGADTMRGLIRQLVPAAEFVSRPRFSSLSYTGERKLSRLPRRSAIVAFTATDVYALAELTRRQRGGAAVILGALSPRTRNAQVALYQSGEVDYLVATDAIGMGLNMDVDHVAFAARSKFDGFMHRNLTVEEISQIAGRAGRHLNDGTFGSTGKAGAFDEAEVERITEHRFAPQRRIQWRNRRLDYTSPSALLHSLRRPSNKDVLLRARDADDVIALQTLTAGGDIAELARSAAALRKLWEICQIPDFSKTSPAAHHSLLSHIYRHVVTGDEVLPEDWVAGHIERLDRSDGDIDTLAARIAHVRTWTYVSHRAHWLKRASYWQERSREVEDKLSDALHAALTQRFVDRRTTVLFRSLSDKKELFGAVTAEGDVLVEGQYIGRLRGFRFELDAAASGHAARAVRAAANRVLAREIAKRAEKLLQADDGEFDWRDDNRIYWQGTTVAHLAAGATILSPRIALLPVDHLNGPLREQVRNRLQQWLDGQIEHELAALYRVRAASLSPPARGVIFQLLEGLGQLPRQRVTDMVRDLSPDDRSQLYRLGVRLGFIDIFMPGLLKPARRRTRRRLWTVFNDRFIDFELSNEGLMSFPIGNGIPDEELQLLGYRRFGDIALRMDIADRLAGLARKKSRNGPFSIDAEMLSITGCGRTELKQVLTDIGYRGDGSEEDEQFTPAGRRNRRKRKGHARNGRNNRADVSSPFAALEKLKNRG